MTFKGTRVLVKDVLYYAAQGKDWDWIVAAYRNSTAERQSARQSISPARRLQPKLRDAEAPHDRDALDFLARPQGRMMPRKIKELIRELEAAGFVDRGGKGSHRNFIHIRVTKPITLSGKLGDDAKRYQERAVKAAIEESKK